MEQCVSCLTSCFRRLSFNQICCKSDQLAKLWEPHLIVIFSYWVQYDLYWPLLIVELIAVDKKKISAGYMGGLLNPVFMYSNFEKRRNYFMPLLHFWAIVEGNCFPLIFFLEENHKIRVQTVRIQAASVHLWGHWPEKWAISGVSGLVGKSFGVRNSCFIYSLAWCDRLHGKRTAGLTLPSLKHLQFENDQDVQCIWMDP